MNARVRALRAGAVSESDLELGQTLVREYVEATAQEMAAPGVEPDLELILPYVPDYHDLAGRYLDGGAFLVAEVDDAVAGCVGITRIDERVCEMNRLWVRPPFRRAGLGRTLATASLDEARRLGFARMILDVLSTRPGAVALYRSLGFTDAPPGHEYAFDVEMVFLTRDL